MLFRNAIVYMLRNKRKKLPAHTIFTEPIQSYITFYYPNGVKTSETPKQKPLEMNNSGKYYTSLAHTHTIHVNTLGRAYAFIIVIVYLYICIYGIHMQLSYNFISPDSLAAAAPALATPVRSPLPPDRATVSLMFWISCSALHVVK